MQQTPVHEQHNPDLLDLVPLSAKRVLEVGCSAGALAREFKKGAPGCDYLGIEIDPAYAELAARHCDRTMVLDIEQADDAFWAEHGNRDCWIFGDTLEHLRDPWALLRRIRSGIPAHGAVVACIPNAQHWSLQARLSIGDFRYEDAGLLDRTHLRFFTRQTIEEMFDQAGFKIGHITPRVFPHPSTDAVMPVIRKMAQLLGADPAIAEQDAKPLQYVVHAVPK
jgi:2-polyprenyl-3-methyl-5-hydroxy-6-metoxy-1,4-benzoquinol methylase